MSLCDVRYYCCTGQNIAGGVAEIFVQKTQAVPDEAAEVEADSHRRVLNAVAQVLSIDSRPGVRHGCPIALVLRDFCFDMPQVSLGTARPLSL